MQDRTFGHDGKIKVKLVPYPFESPPILPVDMLQYTLNNSAEFFGLDPALRPMQSVWQIAHNLE